MSNKTKEPTPKKLRDAAERGDIAKSQSFASSISMLVWWMLVLLAPAAIFRLLLPFIRDLASVQAMQDALASRRFFLEVLGIGLMVPAGVGLLLAFALGLVQSRGRIARKREPFDLKRLNPVSGLKQLFGLQKLATVGLSTLKMVMICAIGYRMGRDLLAELDHLPDSRWRWPSVFLAAWHAGWLAAGLVVLGCAALGVCDLLIQHKLWIRRHRMSDDEIKREYKEQEGSPEIKGARRRMHRELTS
ncbi:MAG TPA: EscU/YscU/HrcU family type III secretion system export apparatus switch protein [Dyella sp.]|uniref:EscU/YscU/HrcU family type III secretion system export apparatus switch protein n=1 Tax=Dyella sp. TaxID=1869338 RepID=UPI002BDDDF12|nr:EscU/YscU/HrcU family type III secretion system export apparatus switch protein [Dyella sp.]HTV87281.1 EscU/YscU/HrcU family type III secretion system export apparatus switch protein [Dyella sp.]